MAKRSRKRTPREEPIVQKAIPIASTEDLITGDQTLPPEGNEGFPDGRTWYEKGTTATSPDDEDEMVAVGTHVSYPSLIGNFLAGTQPISWKRILEIVFFLLIIAYPGVTGWMFIQDNGGGKLDTIDGLHQFWVKFTYLSYFAVVVVGILIVALIIISIRDWARGRIKIRKKSK